MVEVLAEVKLANSLGGPAISRANPGPSYFNHQTHPFLLEQCGFLFAAPRAFLFCL